MHVYILQTANQLAALCRRLVSKIRQLKNRSASRLANSSLPAVLLNLRRGRALSLSRLPLAIIAFIFGLVSPSSRACSDSDSLWDELTNFFSDAWDAISSFASSIWDAVVSLFEYVWDVISDFFSWLDEPGAGGLDPSLTPRDAEERGMCSDDDLFGWYEDGANHFTAYEGNAYRLVGDLEVKGGSAPKFSFARIHNTVPRKGKLSLGQGGNWRHSWQYDLIETQGTNGPAELLLVTPGGRRVPFSPAEGGGWAPPSNAFTEAIVTTDYGYDVSTSAGSRMKFFRVRENNGTNRYEMRELVNLYGQSTQLDYNTNGDLARVTDPYGRFFNLSYAPAQVTTASWQRFVTVKTPPAQGQWLEFAVPEALRGTQFQILRLVGGRKSSPISVAEVQFYAPGSDTPLTGTVKSAGAGAASATDGSPNTSYKADGQSLGLIALDLGPDHMSRVAKIRVLATPGAEDSLKGAKLEGMTPVVETRSVLAKVDASDGSSANYGYSVMSNPYTGQQHAVLTNVMYGDGTQAAYSYSYNNADHKPLLTDADDPRFHGQAKQIRYTYQPNSSVGMIHQEINPATGGAYASLELDQQNAESRIVRYSDLRTISYTFPKINNGRPATRVDSLGRKTQFVYEQNGAGRLVKRIDHAGRETTFDYDDSGRIKAERANGKLKKQLERDSKGRIVKTVDEHGKTVTFQRDANGRIVRRTGHDGKAIDLTYDAAGRVTSMKDGAGLHKFEYDSRGNRTSWTNPRGQTMKFTYDGRDRLVQIQDPTGRTTKRELNDRGLPTKITGPTGAEIHKQYDKYGRIIGSSDAKGQTTRVSYDELGRVVRSEDNAGHVTKFDYTEIPNGCGSCTLTPNPSRIATNEGITLRLYDSEGRLLTETKAYGTSAQNTTTYTYDADNNVIAIADPLGATTRFTYDDQHHLLTTTDPAGRTSLRSYDDLGRLAARTDPAGNTTSYTYDSAGKVAAVKDASGATTRYEYDDVGNITVVTDSSGKKTRYTYEGRSKKSVQYPDGKKETWEYDNSGRVTKYVTVDGLETSYTYDTGADPVTTVDSSGRKSTAQYDSAGRKISATDAFGRTAAWTYDTSGNLTSTTAFDGVVTTYTYDAKNQLLSSATAGGGTTTFTYDSAGNQISRTDALRNTYQYSYDGMGRRTATKYPDGTQELTVYDSNGNVVSQTTRAGQTKTITYNAANQPTKETWAPSSAAPETTYLYDSAGRLQSMDNHQVKITYAYDALNRISGESQNIAATVASLPDQTTSYRYDAFGRRSEITFPEQTKVGYDYDYRGRLTGIRDGGGKSLASYEYGPQGLLSSVAHGNGIRSAYEYSTLGTLIGITHTKANTVIASSQYTLDSLARRVAQVRETGATDRYSYDSVGQLIRAEYGLSGAVESFGYDVMGNRTTSSYKTSSAGTVDTTYRVNQLNQYTQIANASCQYDQNGNYIGNGNYTLAYNAMNQLIQVDTPTALLRLYYDALGRCAIRLSYDKVNGAPVINNTKSVELIYDTAWNLIGQRTLAGDSSWFVRGRQLSEVVYAYGAIGSQYPLADGLGSVIAVTDSKGGLQATAAYEAFGRTKNYTAAGSEASASPSALPFQYTGAVWLPSIGFTDNRNRFYIPEIGRWPSVDPIGFSGGANLYSYCLNSPIQYSDVTGLVRDGESCSKAEAGTTQEPAFYYENTGLGDSSTSSTLTGTWTYSYAISNNKVSGFSLSYSGVGGSSQSGSTTTETGTQSISTQIPAGQTYYLKERQTCVCQCDGFWNSLFGSYHWNCSHKSFFVGPL